MSTKGTQFSRTMRYFQEADIHEASAALNAATGIVTERKREHADFQPGPRKRRARKAKTNSADAAGSQETLANA